MTMITHAYVKNKNSRDLHQELVIACLLYVLNRVGRMNKLCRDKLHDVFKKNMNEVSNKKPGTVRPSLAACNGTVV